MKEFIGGFVGAVGGIVAAAIVENPLAVAVIGVAAVGYCTYKAGEALVEAVTPLVKQAADTVSDAYNTAVDEVDRLINGAPAVVTIDGDFTAPPPNARVIQILKT